jgi:tripartite-type tricarboxylate transporter receptor subunit TctC
MHPAARLSKRKALAFTAASAALYSFPLAAFAQAIPWPNKPVRIFFPTGPGGANDAILRVISVKLQEIWKQSVIIDFKAGAGIIIGTDFVAKSPPDGYTLGIAFGALMSTHILQGNKLPYDTLKDLTGVMQLTRFHMAIYAHPSLPANTPAEFLELAKKKPPLSYASATTQSYLGMSLLNMMAKTPMDYVAYKGSAQALNDVLGGHIKLMIDPVLHSTLQHVQSGKLKLIGTLGSKSAELTPNTPAFGKLVPSYDFSGVFGLVARAGTPPALVRQIRDDFASVMQQPEVAERIRSIGQEAIVSTPDEYNAYILEEMKKWAPVVQATGAKLD